MSISIARLASLDLIRGFVAVGRRMSITQAADDLCITQSAVSRQVRTLEEVLGVKLLTRAHRAIAFTPEGERLFRTADTAVQNLQDAVSAVRAESVRHPVTITCTIGIAGLWLLPRLRDFQEKHPGIDVRIAASERVEDLRGEGIDLAIRYSSKKTVPEGAEKLFDEIVVPVAHPQLGLDAIDSPAVLGQQVLLEFDGAHVPWLKWQEWLISQGWESARPKSTLRFNQYDQVISAALAGQGIALGRLKLLGPMLAEGRLCVLRAPKTRLSTSYAYWLLTARENPRPDVATTANWIREQANEENKLATS